MVDDRFPCLNAYNGPSFASVNQQSKAIWPLILEKAWAKVNGCYELTTSGSNKDSAFCLTGAPGLHYDHKDIFSGKMSQDELWQKISDSCSRKFIVCASSKSDADQRGGHAYSLMETKTVKLRDGQVFKLLKLMNPWGKEAENGSSETNQRMERQIVLDYSLLQAYPELGDKSTGVFYVEYDQFLSLFETTYVSMVQNNYHYKWVSCDFKDTEGII